MNDYPATDVADDTTCLSTRFCIMLLFQQVCNCCQDTEAVDALIQEKEKRADQWQYNPNFPGNADTCHATYNLAMYIFLSLVV